MDKASKGTIRSIIGFLFWTLLGVVTALAILVAFLKFSPYTLVDVHGPSMEPTFEDGSLLVIRNDLEEGGVADRSAIALFSTPKEWQVAAKLPEGPDLIKRVVAVPGDRVSYGDSRITIEAQDGEKYHVANGQLTNCVVDEGESLELAKGQYMLAGDNRAQSFDSVAAWCMGLDPIIDEKSITLAGQPTFNFNF